MVKSVRKQYEHLSTQEQRMVENNLKKKVAPGVILKTLAKARQKQKKAAVSRYVIYRFAQGSATKQTA